jgi:hypothetical protein
MRNASDPEKVKESKEKSQRRRDREIDDMKFILNTVQGRRILHKYLSQSGVWQSSFTGNSETFFREGERNMGLKMLADINDADPEFLMIMTKEAKQDL